MMFLVYILACVIVGVVLCGAVLTHLSFGVHRMHTQVQLQREPEMRKPHLHDVIFEQVA